MICAAFSHRDPCPECGICDRFWIEISQDGKPHLLETVCSYCSRTLASRRVLDDPTAEDELRQQEWIKVLEAESDR